MNDIVAGLIAVIFVGYIILSLCFIGETIVYNKQIKVRSIEMGWAQYNPVSGDYEITNPDYKKIMSLKNSN